MEYKSPLYGEDDIAIIENDEFIPSKILKPIQ